MRIWLEGARFIGARLAITLGAGAALLACGGGDRPADAGAAPAAQQASGAEETVAVRPACEVLTAADVSAIVGQTVEARVDPEEQGSRYSSCGYYPPGPETYGLLYLTVYWSGGREEWDTWQMATSMAGRTWEQTEKVSLDSIMKAGPVGGLGDRAYYGGLLPSLVLKGDVLLEYKLAMVPDEEKTFPRLAKAALARL